MNDKFLFLPGEWSLFLSGSSPWMGELAEAMDGRPEKRDSIHQGGSGELLSE